YVYVLLYTDDCRVVSDNAEEILKKEIDRYFELKEAPIGSPELYLGGHLCLVQINDGTQAWVFSSTQYVQADVKSVEDYLSKQGKSLKRKASSVLQLEAEEASYYQSLTVILRWMVGLGRADICTEVSMMSSHLALLRRTRTQRWFSTPRTGIHMAYFLHEDWSLSIYDDVEHKLPPQKPFEESGPGDMPEPRGEGFRIVTYMGCNLGGDCVAHRSRTGFAVFLNGAPLYWMSKKQSSWEVSTFGSEFTTMKQPSSTSEGS
ncbi:hypothetical protein ACHAWF_016479, partial [Thalassiosira exigua]